MAESSESPQSPESSGPIAPRRVLLVTAGSHGDVHPFLAIGRALAARGHHVGVLVNPHFDREVFAAKLEFLPFGERLTTERLIRDYGVMHPVHGSRRVLQLLCDLAPTSVTRMREAFDEFRPDVIAGHHICLGLTDVARERRIPVALTMLAPSPLFSKHDPVLTTQMFPGTLGRIVSRVVDPVARTLVLPLMNRVFRRARAACGLPRVADEMRHEWCGGDALLGMWSSSFRGAVEDDPPHLRICGFPLYDEPNAPPLPHDIETFLAEGEPPLLFCLGSTAVHIAGGFYDNAIAVARDLGRRALLLAGPAAERFDGIADGVRAFAYAPLSRVAPRCAASVIHGGIGTTAQALRAGKPVLVAPFAHDQFNNGVRVAKLGCGDSISVRRLSAKRMTTTLARLLGSESIGTNCARIGETLRAEHGAERAADVIAAL